MKVLKTRVADKASKTTVASSTDFYPDIENGFSTIENDESIAVKSDKYVMTKDGFISLLESSSLLGYILETLRELYLLRYSDYGECSNVLMEWLSEVQSSFTSDVLDLLSDNDKISEVGDAIIKNLIDPIRIRLGVLDINYKLPLIGESKHVK